MLESLHAAIAEQYQAFTARQPRTITACPCCTEPAELQRLVAAPREALEPGTLARYAHKAMTTIGDEEDFRYFWPRLSELCVDQRLITSVEIVFGKPLYGNHHTWPAREQTALLGLASALGEWIAAEDLEADQVDTWVCAIGLLCETLTDPRRSVAPLLSDTPTARANLRAFVSWNRGDILNTGRLANGFWDKAPQSAASVIEWLQTEPRAMEQVRVLQAEDEELYGIVPPASRTEL